MMNNLRWYQKEAARRVAQRWKAFRNRATQPETTGTTPISSTVVVLPTGTGKTTLGGTIFRLVLDKEEIHSRETGEARRPVVWLTHLDKLVKQSAESLQELNPDKVVAIEQAGVHAPESADIIVVSVPSVGRKGSTRLDWLKKRGACLVIADECHHTESAMWKLAIDKVTGGGQGFLLGLTATIDRTDKKELVGEGKIFHDIAFEYRLVGDEDDEYNGQVGALADGSVCAIRAFTVRTKVSLDEIKTRGGDLAQDELAKVVDNEVRTELAFEAWEEKAKDRITAGFCASVPHAHHAAELWRKKGYTAEAIDSSMPEEEVDNVLKRWKSGATRLVFNYGILTEGFDYPAISCVLLLRPTKSRLLYTQCLDSETEVLTTRGWRGIDDELEEGEQAYALDATTNKVVKTEVLNKFVRPVGKYENMVSYVSPHLDVRVTNGHRMLVDEVVTRGGEKSRTGLRFRLAENVARIKQSFCLPCSGEEEAGGVPLSQDELQLVGLIVADGALHKNGQLMVTQSSRQKWIPEVDRLFASCGIKHTKSVRDRVTNLGATNTTFWSSGAKAWQHLKPYCDKKLSVLLEDATPEQFGYFLEGLHLGDGSKQVGQTWTRRSYHIACSGKEFADRLQTLCVRKGYTCNIAVSPPCGVGVKPVYTAHIKHGQTRMVGGKNQYDRPHFETSQPKEGERVWCLETGTGTLITRRNLKVCFMGNCVGRGFRPYTGKDYLLLLDVADLTSKHKLQRPLSLLGLELPQMGYDGEPVDLKELSDVVIEAKKAGKDPTKAKSREDIETMLLPVDVFDVTKIPAGAERSKLSWVSDGKGGYKLYIPRAEKGEEVNYKDPPRFVHLTDKAPSPHLYGFWYALYSWKGEEFAHNIGMSNRGRPPEFHKVDPMILGMFKPHENLIRRNVGWKLAPPTDRQKELLRKMRMSQEKIETITAGQAADYINLVMNGDLKR